MKLRVLPRTCLCAALLVAASVATATAQHRIHRSAAVSGFVHASGGSQKIHGTLGQPIIGTAKNRSHAGFFGFWYDSDNATVDVEAVQRVPPADFALLGVYPQPARCELTCILRLPERGFVQLDVHGLLGRLIHRGTVQLREAGTYRMQLSLPRLPSGIYLLNARWNGETVSRRLAVFD